MFQSYKTVYLASCHFVQAYTRHHSMQNPNIIRQTAIEAGIAVSILAAIVGWIYFSIVDASTGQMLTHILTLVAMGFLMGTITGALICRDFVAKKLDFYAMAILYSVVLGGIELGLAIWLFF